MSSLHIDLPDTWIDISAENSEGPPTFVRDTSGEKGVLQISLQAEYWGGEVPNPTYPDLEQLAASIAGAEGGTIIGGQSSGDCTFGTYGSATASIDGGETRLQVWVLCNSRDFVLATLVTGPQPDADEFDEAEAIVKLVALRPDSRPWWKLW